MRSPDRNENDPRGGIALIIVLGFLSLLVIMGVGFAISMRVERLAARNALDLVRTRQLGQAALARVMEDIQTDLAGRMAPDWSGHWANGAFESYQPGGSNVGPFITGYATNYYPLSLEAGLRAAEANATWIPFSYLSRSGQTVTNGRLAYVLLDCSGLWDVNYDYSPTNNQPRPRLFGASPYEVKLQPTLMTELKANRWTNMIWCRIDTNTSGTLEKPWIRLESVAEIGPVLAQGFGNQQPLTPAGQRSRNLITYSRFPAGYQATPATVEQPVFVGGNEATVRANEGPIKAQFTAMGIPPTEVDNLFNNLIDYVDTENQPENRRSFGTEAVPMLNEIVVSNYYDRIPGTPDTYVNRFQVHFEVYYPFSTPNAHSYSINFRARYEDGSPTNANPPDLNIPIPIPGPWTNGRVVTVFSAFSATPSSVVPFDLSAARVRIRATVVEDGALEVDEFGVLAATYVEIGPQVVGFGGYALGLAALDPRINWDGTDLTQWVKEFKANLSLGVANPQAVAASTAPTADGSQMAYVRNGPLQTVGELGLLLYDRTKPWTTIGLLAGPNYFPVLDRFTVTTNQTRQGLVNPNSQNPNVLGSVFAQMPLDRVPYDPAATTSTVAQASAFAASLKAMGTTNLSDLKNMGPGTAAFGALDAARKESVIRNSAGLLSPRQNLFTVFLLVQLNSPLGDVLGEQSGVGLIWRDPYEENGAHAIHIRNFRWLTE